MSNMNFTQDDIESAHDAVQHVFQGFVEKVQERLPTVRAIFGKASNDRFPLYTYVTFEDKQMPDVDPAVAAVDIHIDGDRLAVKTDLIGEESGDVYLKPMTQMIAVGPDQSEWLSEVGNEAQRLADRALPVVERLFGSSPPVMPSQGAGLPEVARKANV
jgi:hypothetical protein